MTPRRSLPRTVKEAAAIHQAAAAVGVDVDDLQPVSQGRTGVYRVVVRAAAQRQELPCGVSVQAARVITLTDSIMPPPRTHQLVHQLHGQGAPVAAPRHRDSIVTGGGHVGFWQWLTDTYVTPWQWGEVTGAFHRAGRRVPPVRPYDPGAVFGPRLRRARELTARRGHPLYGAHALVRSFEAALQTAVEAATAAAAAVDPADQVLALGDNQPGNVMAAPPADPSPGPVGSGPSRSPDGGLDRLVLNDFERIATGPPALDLAAVVLGVQHFGFPPWVAEEFRAGYEAGSGAAAPTLRQAAPFARVRELSGAVVTMLQAGDDAETEREMRVRTTAISDPGAGGRWTYIGNRNAMALAGVPTPYGHGQGH